MKSSDTSSSSGPTSPSPKEQREANGGLKAPRSTKAGSDNTLGDGRTSGGGYNADKRDQLEETGKKGGDSHGDGR